MNKNKLNELHQRRDERLIEEFCSKEVFIGEGAQPVRVCRMIPFDELLTILHQYDAKVIEELKQAGAIDLSN